MNQKRSILIGNGFNLALNLSNNRLDYRSITDQILKNKDPSLCSVVEECKRKNIIDIERILCLLQPIPEIIHTFEKSLFNQIPSEICETANKVYETLYEKFITTLINNHPKQNEVFNSKKLEIVKNNLIEFDEIYTLNYDLILYWLIMWSKDLKEKFKDGFSDKHKNICYINKKAKNTLFYLHGALHLWKFQDKTFKITSAFYNNMNLLDAISTNLLDKFKENSIDHSLSSEIVCSGDAKLKEKIIYNSGYLRKCIENLSSLDGELFIYGCRSYGKTNDEHIWEAIAHSNLTDIYIGLFNENELNIVGKMKSLLKNKNIYRYETSKLNIWEVMDFSGKVISEAKV